MTSISLCRGWHLRAIPSHRALPHAPLSSRCSWVHRGNHLAQALSPDSGDVAGAQQGCGCQSSAGPWAVPEGKSHAAQSPVVPQPVLGPGLAATPWPRSLHVQICNAGRAEHKGGALGSCMTAPFPAQVNMTFLTYPNRQLGITRHEEKDMTPRMSLK